MSAITQPSGKPRGRGGKRSTSFAKGQSGNPAGRPKRTPEEFALIQACKDKTPAALGVIESIMMNGENERNRLAAAQAIIERAYGKPEQPVTGAGGGPLQVVGSITFVRPSA